MTRVDLGRSHWGVCYPDRLKRWLGFNLFKTQPHGGSRSGEPVSLSGFVEVL